MAIKFSKSPQRRDRVREKKQRKDKWQDRRAFMVAMCGGECGVCGTTKNLWFEWVGKGKPKEHDRMAKLLTYTIHRLMAQKLNFRMICRKHWWEKRKKEMGTKKHGTVSMYANRSSRCRCKKCRAAWNEYSKKWHKKKRDTHRVARKAILEGRFNFLA